MMDDEYELEPTIKGNLNEETGVGLVILYRTLLVCCGV